MKAIARGVVAVLLGLAAGMLVISAVEAVGGVLFPIPGGVDLKDPAAARSAFARLPIGAFLMALAALGLGAGIAAWVAAKVAGRAPRAYGMGIAAFFAVAAVANMMILPHPAWFWAASLTLIPVSAWAGSALAARGPGRPAGAAVVGEAA